MNNSYPDVFNINCAGNLPCDTPGPGCQIKGSKVINVNNKEISNKRNITLEYRVNNKSVPFERKNTSSLNPFMSNESFLFIILKNRYTRKSVHPRDPPG